MAKTAEEIVAGLEFRLEDEPVRVEDYRNEAESRGIVEYFDEGGRPQLAGYWSLREGRPRYTSLRKPSGQVQSEYNPFSRERMP